MNYIQILFDLDDRYHEQMIAELAELDFYGFEQLENQLLAYIEAPRFSDTSREMIEQMILLIPNASMKEIGQIEEENWNQVWEQSIQPQRIGKFLVRPTWSGEVAQQDEILLEIDPKMAFGTGYHATTRLMLKQLDQIDFKNKTVLDAGTGTGILAIAAIKLGAKKAVGFDIDPWSKENAFENTLINGVEKSVDIRFGSTEQIKEDEKFDIILANINRNIILELIPFFVSKANENGTICLTGLLDVDEKSIRDSLVNEPVNIVDLQQENEWILFHLTKRV